MMYSSDVVIMESKKLRKLKNATWKLEPTCTYSWSGGAPTLNEIRDKFASLALQAMIASRTLSNDMQNDADLAYDWADFMMAERAKRIARDTAKPATKPAKKRR